MDYEINSDIDFENMTERPAKTQKDIKIRRTIRIDLEVFSWVKDQAAKEGVPYQTHLNNLLKKAMLNDSNNDLESRLSELEKKVASLG